MAKAKFEVTIGGIDEDHLGPVLAKMPENVTVNIKLTTQSPKIAAAATKSAPQTIPQPSRIKSMADMIAPLPDTFRAKDFVPIIEANGFNGNSISHFLRRALDDKLIAKVPGLYGNKVAYRKK